MSLGSIFQLVMLCMRLANWLTARIDRAEWKRLGFDEALATARAELDRNVGLADDAAKAAKAAKPEQRKTILEGDL